jgi:hypothetical protein
LPPHKHNKNHHHHLLFSTMKFAAVFVAIAAYVATTEAAACSAGETLKLAGLVFEPSRAQCEKDSGFTFIPPPGPPTSAQVDKMCASAACPKTIAALQKLNPSDCDLTFSNGVTLNVKKLLDTLTPACGRRQ